MVSKQKHDNDDRNRNDIIPLYGQIAPSHTAWMPITHIFGKSSQTNALKNSRKPDNLQHGFINITTRENHSDSE